MSGPDAIAAADTKLRAARTAFVLGKDPRSDPAGAGVYAFFASLCLRLELVHREDVGTMATDGRHLFWAEQYVTPLTPHQTLSEIAHETGHCMLAHIARIGALVGTAATPAQLRRVQIAADCALDPILRDAGFWSPAGAIFPGAFGLAEGLTLEEYYRLLPDESEDGPAGHAAQHGQAVPAVPRDGDGPGDAAAAQAAGADWRVATENARRAAKMRGSLPGSLDAVCNALVAPVIDWRDVLREFFRAIARDDYSWVRPNRRHVADGLYLPSCYSERLGRLVVVVDTSGSMTDTAVQRGFSEVAAILAERPMGVDLLLHDSKLYATHTIDIDAGDEFPQELKMRRGGTSHVPAFAWIAEHGEDVAAVLCLTDCESDLDSVIVPDCPVLFARPARCRSLPPAWAAGLLTLP